MWRRVQQFLVETYRHTQQAQREHLERNPGFDWEPAVVLTLAALALTFRSYYYLLPNVYEQIDAALPAQAAEWLTGWTRQPENKELARLLNWVFAQTVAFLGAPLIGCLILRRRPRDYALKFSGAFTGWKFYLAMYLLMLPGLYVAAQTTAFQHSYPFYRLEPEESLWPRLVIWELAYAWQFIALEFFFRGFLVHGTKRSCGVYSIFVMMAPYCMLHFGKPPLETLGSIIAGIALGWMSLGTRSAWMGAALHIAVAWTMDLLALQVAGRL